MTQPPGDRRDAAGTEVPSDDAGLGEPTLAEDLLVLLFQPGTGSIVGEGTLYYVLAGAVLADLALDGRVKSTTSESGTPVVSVAEGRAPSDGILRSAWDYLAGKPRGVHTALAAIGPALRQPVLERLIARGDVRKESRKALGLFTTTVLEDGGSGRRAGLLEDVRTVLVDGAEPTPRVAALAALIWGSNTLHQFDPQIPWNSAVITRAQDLARGDWSAGAAGEAVSRATAAIIAIIAATVAPGR